jgi:hypothetical protein
MRLVRGWALSESCWMPESGDMSAFKIRPYHQVLSGASAIRCLPAELRFSPSALGLFWPFPFSSFCLRPSLPRLSDLYGVESRIFFFCLLFSTNLTKLLSSLHPFFLPTFPSHIPLFLQWINPLSPTRLPCTMCSAAEALSALPSCSITLCPRPTVCLLVLGDAIRLDGISPPWN